MKKYFVVSDIHGFYKELISALKKEGFDKRNKDHNLIVCGDVFDRGNEPVKVYKFLRSIPKKRCILVRGNHEDLFLRLVEKGYPDWYDYTNGTYDTLESFVNEDKLKEVVDWLNDKRWKNYYEVGKYIFVHSFIPENTQNWRDLPSDDIRWKKSRWGCPWQSYLNGGFKFEKELDKVLVCGHWHIEDFKTNLDGTIEQNGMFVSRDNGLIAIDNGVKYVGSGLGLEHKQVVMVINYEE